MPKGLIILANGFEESEAIITIDIIKRSKIELDLVSLEKDNTVTSSNNIVVTCDKNYKNINLQHYDFLIIPGGKAVFRFHLDSLITKSMVEFFMTKNKLVAAICAAPMILGKYGYLKDLEYTCFPGCESEEYQGILKQSNAVTCKNIITGKAAGATFDFAYNIVEYLLGIDSANNVINEVYYQKTTK